MTSVQCQRSSVSKQHQVRHDDDDDDDDDDVNIVDDVAVVEVVDDDMIKPCILFMVFVTHADKSCRSIALICICLCVCVCVSVCPHESG